MGIIAVGYCLPGDMWAAYSADEQQDLLELARDELSQGREFSADDELVIRRLLGIVETIVERRLDLAACFRWYCHTFGQPIQTDSLVLGIYNLEVDTGLLRYQPPCGFIAPDENISWLARDEVLAEWDKNRGCAVEAKTEHLRRQRSAYLQWLQACSLAKCDLVVVES